MSEETGSLALFTVPALPQFSPQLGQLPPPQDYYAITVRVFRPYYLRPDSLIASADPFTNGHRGTFALYESCSRESRRAPPPFWPIIS